MQFEGRNAMQSPKEQRKYCMEISPPSFLYFSTNYHFLWAMLTYVKSNFIAA